MLLQVKRVKNSIKLSILLTGVLLITALSTIASAADDPWDMWNNTYGNAGAAGTFFGVAIAMCIGIIIICLVLAILLAIWIYKDAEKRGKQGILWVILLLVLSLILNFVGLIIVIILWLVIRPPIGGEKAGRVCPNCGRGIPEDARVCPYCSKKFEE
jgi:uncharacterized membrane protein